MRIVLAVIVILAVARPSHACSMSSDLRIEPTTVERVEQATSIVIAEIDRNRNIDPRQHHVPFIAREIFKGPLEVDAELAASGLVDSMMGCGDTIFHAGTAYILFLDTNNHVVDSRGVGGKADTESRYMLVELVRIMALPTRDARNAALRAASAAGHVKRALAEQQYLAAIVDDHLKRPTPWKPFAELAPMLKHAKTKPDVSVLPSERELVVHSIGLGADPAASVFMTDLLHAFRGKQPPLPREEFHAIAAYFAKVTVPNAVGDIVWLYRLTDDQWPWRREVVQAMQRHATAWHEAQH